MAGLGNYGRVYRGRPDEMALNQQPRYTDREVIRPLNIPTVHRLARDSPVPEDEEQCDWVVLGCSVAGLITECLLLHPLIVLRRQCQVNPGACKYHLFPITLLPTVLRLHQTQGLNSLWKGIGSILLVGGMTMAIDDVISKITAWPKNTSEIRSLKSFGQHVLLKCISVGIVTPFYSASLVETVQSEIASEKPGVFDVFRNGAIRLLEVNSKGRLLPIYSLLQPTIVYAVGKYLFMESISKITYRILRVRRKHSQELKGAYSRDLEYNDDNGFIQAKSKMVALMTAEIIFFPLETVVHRLHLQGTRTIIDNLDTGRSVTPLLTGYSGAIDCYRTIVSSEGIAGLYKGFGALLLQIAVHALVYKASKWIISEIYNITNPKTSTMPKKSCSEARR